MNKSSKRVLFTFLFSNLLIILLPLFTFGFSFYHLFTTFREDVTAVTEKQAYQAQYLVEEKITSAYKIATRLERQSDVTFYAQKDSFTDIDVYNTKTLRETLANYIANSSEMHSAYIYFAHSGIIVSNDMVYHADNFYNIFFSYENLTDEQWQEKYLDTHTNGTFLPLAPIQSQGYRFEGSVFIKSIGSQGYNQGTIMIVFNNQDVIAPLDSFVSEYSGYSYIEDKEGNIIFSTIDVHEILENPFNDMFVIRDQSQINGWNYISVLNYDIVFQKTQNLFITIMTMSTLIAFIAIIMAIALARSNARPIRQLYSGIEGVLLDENSKNIYKAIEHSVLSLDSKNKELEHIIGQQLNMIQVNFLKNLVNGNYSRMEEIERESKILNLIWDKNFFCAAILRLENTSRLVNDYDFLSVADIVNKLFDYIMILDNCYEYIFKVNDYDIILLISNNTENIDEIKHKLDKISDKTNELLDNNGIQGLSYKILCGNLYPFITEIQRSYNEALEIFNYKADFKTKEIICYSDLPKQKNFFSYPSNLENDLIRYTRAGDCKVVESIINNIFEENTQSRTLSFGMSKQLISEICGTALRIVEQITDLSDKDINQLLNKIALLNKTDLSLAKDSVFEVFNYFCEYYCEKMKSHNTKLISKIVKYLDDNFNDTSLSLTKVADIFQMSENYLSTFFKEQTGGNFSSYIEDLRIQHAAKLLNETKMPMKDISEAVGYSNAHTFRRAFKKIYNCSPTEYKVKQNNEEHI